MPRYTVYLEGNEDACLAHVAELPGCVVRAPSRAEALARLPAAICTHCAWLRRHGETAPDPIDPIDVQVAGETAGAGPFSPGDSATLLPPDRAPITPVEMEPYFRLMAAARADLLALVRGLPASLLDWVPGPGEFTIRRILRHVGNAGEWYVSRLVPPDTLPPDWAHDAGMTELEFLDMEHCSAVERLRRLTAGERAAIVTPAQWTSHPDEEWTARKALRRAVEHELEHTAQVRAVLEARRADLLHALAAARVRLIAAAQAPAGTGSLGAWTLRDLLAHVAAWDRWAVPEMQRLATGECPSVEGAGDPDAFNAAAVDAARDWSLSQAWAELHAARAAMVDWLAAVPVEALFRVYCWHGDDWYLPDWLRIYWEHDAEHAAQIAPGPAE